MIKITQSNNRTPSQLNWGFVHFEEQTLKYFECVEKKSYTTKCRFEDDKHNHTDFILILDNSTDLE